MSTRYFIVMVLVVLVVVSHAALKNRRVTDTDGNTYDVTQISNGEEDISLITKDGLIVEQQIVHQQQEYVVYKQNTSCSIQCYGENETQEGKCPMGVIPNEDEITDEMKSECGDLEIVFVKMGDCPEEEPTGNKDHADGGIQKRWIRRRCRRVYYFRYVCCWFTCRVKRYYYTRCRY